MQIRVGTVAVWGGAGCIVCASVLLPATCSAHAQSTVITHCRCHCAVPYHSAGLGQLYLALWRGPLVRVGGDARVAAPVHYHVFRFCGILPHQTTKALRLLLQGEPAMFADGNGQLLCSRCDLRGGWGGGIGPMRGCGQKCECRNCDPCLCCLHTLLTAVGAGFRGVELSSLSDCHWLCVGRAGWWLVYRCKGAPCLASAAACTSRPVGHEKLTTVEAGWQYRNEAPVSQDYNKVELGGREAAQMAGGTNFGGARGLRPAAYV
jgi:hypothetical protein